MAKHKYFEGIEEYTGSHCPDRCACTAEASPRNCASVRVIITLIAVLTMLLVGLTGCGSDDNAAPDPTESEATTVDPNAPTYVELTPEEWADIAVPDIEETELYNENDIVITATQAEADNNDIAINISVKNDGTEDVSVVTQYLSVNGYMLSMSSMYCEAGAGKTGEGSIFLYHDELKQAGINTIAQVQLRLRIYSRETFEDIAVTDVITLDISGTEDYVQSVDDSGKEIYNKDGARVVYQGIKSVWYGDTVLMFFFENTGERNITIYADSVSANGTAVDTSFWADLLPNSRSLNGMSFYNLEALSLESPDQLTELEFTLHILDSDTWEELEVSDPIVMDLTQ